MIEATNYKLDALSSEIAKCGWVLPRVTRFEFVKKRTLRRGTPPIPRDGILTYFSHADDPAPSPLTKFEQGAQCCQIGNGEVSYQRLKMIIFGG